MDGRWPVGRILVRCGDVVAPMLVPQRALESLPASNYPQFKDRLHN